MSQAAAMQAFLCPTVSDAVDCTLGREYLEIQKDVNLGVLKLVDHLCDPGVVQEINVLKPAALHSKQSHRACVANTVHLILMKQFQ